MLTFSINMTSVQESNIFLRKLWSELNQIKPMGWDMYPYKEEKRVTIGKSNLGEISFDYKQKGCIKNIYIDNDDNAEAIAAAVQRAKTNKMKKYGIALLLRNDNNIAIAEASFEGCSVFSLDGKTYVKLQMEAYSAWDVEQFLPNKYSSILSILYEYTQTLFEIIGAQFAEGCWNTNDTDHQIYNYQWMSCDECPCLDNHEIILPRECLQLLSYIMDDNRYNEDIELLLNSSRVLMETKSLFAEIKYPFVSGKADIINSMACSSFEPLALILDKSNGQCKECGNMVFSVVKKIRKMCTRYFDSSFAKYVCDVIYKKRSAFLHMGRQESSQRATRVFCPQISTESGVIMPPHGVVHEAIFCYSSFLFRNVARDYFEHKI